MRRQEIKEKERKDFYLYIDEFQNFATESFIDILAEARKYRLSLIISHQCLNQISEKIKSLILGNVGTLISFRLGVEDAEIIKKEFYPYHFQEELISLPNYNFLARVIINGKKITYPIRGENFFPLSETFKTKTREKIIKISRERLQSKEKLLREKSTD